MIYYCLLESSISLEGGAQILLVLLAAFFLAFVMELSPFAKADGELDPAAFEVNV